MRSGLSLAVALALCLAASGPASNNAASADSYSPTPWANCWSRPEPESIEAAFVRAANHDHYQARLRAIHSQATPAFLALSADGFRTPFAAGLIVGWGETGRRPEFSTVTGVGFGALIAPFAFVGASGDQKLADAFNCDASSWKEIAEHAAGLIDPGMLEAIAKKARAGNELLVGLPGSAARPETVWNFGAIAASGRPDTAHLIGDVLLAAVTPDRFVDPAPYPKSFGFIAERNVTFRKIGAGDPFLLVANPNRRHSAYYLIEGGTVAPFESAQYMASRESEKQGAAKLPRTPLVTAYDMRQAASNDGALFQFSMKPYEPAIADVPDKIFDMEYTRRLFLKTYWTGVLGKGWRLTLTGAE